MLKSGLLQPLKQWLDEMVRESRRQRWLFENGEAIDSYNGRIERRGTFSDRVRRF